MTFLTVEGREIHCDDLGAGTPVVLLHGGGSSGRQWKRLAGLLEERHRCYMPDLFGHGRTAAWTDATPPTLLDYAAVVSTVSAAEGGPVHLVGHSHGGAVAIAFAAARPEALRSLTLIEPTLMHLLREAGSAEAWSEAHALGSRHIAAVAAGRSAEIADSFLPYWIGEAAWREMPDDRRAAIVETMPAVAHFWASEFAETTPPEAYAAIDLPTLLVRGCETRATAREIVDLLAGILPDANLIEIAGAGHMAPLTHGDEVNRAVARHIALNSA